MPRYHVNPANGNVGVCRAKISCPLGGEDIHGDSVSEAARAFERYMETESDVNQFGTLKKTKKDDTREKFEKANRAYETAKATWDDDMAIHNHTVESLEKLRNERDFIAARLAGIPENAQAEWVNRKQDQEKQQVLKEALKIYEESAASARETLSQLTGMRIINEIPPRENPEIVRSTYHKARMRTLDAIDAHKKMKPVDHERIKKLETFMVRSNIEELNFEKEVINDSGAVARLRRRNEIKEIDEKIKSFETELKTI